MFGHLLGVLDGVGGILEMVLGIVFLDEGDSGLLSISIGDSLR